MALFEATHSSDPNVFDLVAVEAGNATALAERVAAAIAAAGPDFIADVSLGAFSAGRQWQCWLTFADTVTSGFAQAKGSAIVIAAEGGSPAEVRAKLLAQLPSAFDALRLLVAGAGIGPSYMGLALLREGGG